MMHLIHMIFLSDIRNLLCHNEGKEPHVGSRESSLATREDNKTRAEISE